MAKAAKQQRALRRGWTTGTCAAAAAKAAYAALVTGEFPDPVAVTLPRGERPSFALAMTRLGENAATAGVIKDAGDDPDVTHGALICATVRLGAPGTGVTFRAGEGVGQQAHGEGVGQGVVVLADDEVIGQGQECRPLAPRRE